MEDDLEWMLLDEVDVMAMWPASKRELLHSAKWSERKQSLEALLELCKQHPRLASASTTVYGEIVDELKKILLKDSNVMVVAVAIQLVDAFARGLRQHFGRFVGMVWPALMEKTKEKKAIVSGIIGECLDAVAATATLERISPPLLEAMQKPNPQSRVLLDNFLFRLLNQQSTAAPPIQFLKEALPVLVKHADGADVGVREAACETLGAAKRLLGKAMDTFLGPIASDTVKLEKIATGLEKAQKAIAQAEEARRAARGLTGIAEVEGAGENGENAENSGTTTGGSAEAATAEIDPWTMADPVNVFAKVTANIKYDELLDSKAWKERLEAVNELEKVLKETPRAEHQSDLGHRVTQLAKIVEKDINIYVASSAASCLAMLADALRTNFAPYTGKVFSATFERFKEKKPVILTKLIECVDAAARTTRLDSFIEELLAAFGKSNPAIRKQTVDFLARLLKNHNSATLPIEPVKQLAPALVKLSSDPDGDIRETVYTALGTILRCVGDRIGKVLVGELSEDKMKMEKIESARDKIQAEKGNMASKEIVRLHPPSEKAAGAAARPVEKKPSAPPPPARRPVPARPLLAMNGNNGATTAANKPNPVRVQPAARPASAATRAPSATSIRTVATRAATSAPRTLSNNMASKASTPVSSRQNSAMNGGGNIPVKPTPVSSRPASRVGTPLRGSREALTGLPTEDAYFTTFDGKDARLIECLPPTAPELAKLASSCCTPSLQALLKTDDFKQQLKTCDVMQEMAQSAIDANSDVVSRWLALRVASNNPMVLACVLPLCAHLFTGDNACLCEAELAVLAPAVLSKVGDTKESVRSDAKAVVLALCESYGAPLLLPHLTESLKAKSIRQRQDTLEIINSLLRTDSALLSIIPERVNKKLTQTLAGLVGEKDALARTAALNTLVLVDAQLKEHAYYQAIINGMPLNQRTLVAERLSRAAYGIGAPRPLAPLPRPTTATTIPSGGGIPMASSGIPRPPSRIGRPASGLQRPQ